MVERIELTRGLVALVDDDDYETIAPFLWYANRSRNVWYACRNYTQPNGKRGILLMHRFIVGAVDRRIQVDHVNVNGLDNRRSNIRICNSSQNSGNVHGRNKTGYKGVTHHGRDDLYRATICVNGRSRCVGYFKNPADAARAYDAAAIVAWGAFARINFPEEGQRGASK